MIRISSLDIVPWSLSLYVAIVIFPVFLNKIIVTVKKVDNQCFLIKPT